MPRRQVLRCLPSFGVANYEGKKNIRYDACTGAEFKYHLISGYTSNFFEIALQAVCDMLLPSTSTPRPFSCGHLPIERGHRLFVASGNQLP